MAKSKLHEEDFIEMLERDDHLEWIAIAAGVSVNAVERRYQRLPADVKARIKAKRRLPISAKNKL